MTQIGIAVVEQNGSFLIGLRTEQGPLAGFHEFPGGKQEPGEATSVTAERECLEETGLEVSAIGLLHQQSFQYEHDRLQLDFWFCQLTAASLLIAQKLSVPWRWVPREQLGSLNFPAANAQILKQLVGSQHPAVVACKENKISGSVD